MEAHEIDSEVPVLKLLGKWGLHSWPPDFTIMAMSTAQAKGVLIQFQPLPNITCTAFVKLSFLVYKARRVNNFYSTICFKVYSIYQERYKKSQLLLLKMHMSSLFN